MQKIQNKDFFEIICQNDEKELNEYLLAKGKSPKAICPIMFVSSESNLENELKD